MNDTQYCYITSFGSSFIKKRRKFLEEWIKKAYIIRSTYPIETNQQLNKFERKEE